MKTAQLVLAFVLGACATAATQTIAAEPPAVEAGVGEVVALEDAEVRTNPPGTAKVTLLARGKNAFVGKLEMDAAAKVPEHTDATEEYIHILEGEGTITIEGTEHVVKAGSTIYMPAGARVSYENGPTALVAIQVFAGPEPADKYLNWR